MRRKRRVDRNQAEIVAALRACGCSVECLSDVGRGVPDLLVSKLRPTPNGLARETFMVEVKQSGENLNAEQIKWRDAFQGEYIVMTDVRDVEKLFGVTQTGQTRRR